MQLKHLKDIAEAYLGEKIKDVVMTVPDFFSLDQIQATKNAAILAGLNIVRTIHESSAALTAFGFWLINQVINIL